MCFFLKVTATEINRDEFQITNQGRFLRHCKRKGQEENEKVFKSTI